MDTPSYYQFPSSFPEDTMAVASDSAYHFFRPNILLFILTGIWSPYYYHPETSLRRRLYQIYTYFILSVCIGYLVQGVVEFRLRYDSLSVEDVTEFYSYIVHMTTGLLKVFFLDRNEGRMRNLFREVEKAPFHRPDDETFQLKLQRMKKTTIKIMVLFWIPIYLTLFLKLATVRRQSLLNRELFERVCGGGANGTVTDPMVDCSSQPKLVMPWLTWFPFDTDTSPGHYVGVAYQMLVMTFFASYIFNFDMYITSWMMYISFQLELMVHDLQTLRCRSEEKVREVQGESPLLDEYQVTLEMVQGIRRIIDLHHEIMRLFYYMQDSLSVILMVQYFWVSILICMLMVQMSMNHPLSTAFLSATVYLSVGVMQIFVVFYYANEVKLQSLKIPSAVFYCGWHLSGRHSHLLKPYVLFLIACTNKEVRVLAGGVFDVDMVAFLKVMKASYSYFALVNSSSKK